MYMHYIYKRVKHWVLSQPTYLKGVDFSFYFTFAKNPVDLVAPLISRLTSAPVSFHVWLLSPQSRLSLTSSALIQNADLSESRSPQ